MADNILSDSLISDAFDLGSAPEGGSSPATPASEPVTPQTDPAPGTPETPDVELADDRWVTFHDGKEKVRKLWKEIKQTQYLLPGDYTRKTQAVATDRKSLQSEREQFDQLRTQFDTERAQLVANLRDKKKLEAIWLALDAADQGRQGQPGIAGAAAPEPTAPAIDPQVLVQAVQQYVQATLNERDHKAASAAWAQHGGREIETHIESLTQTYPTLKAMPKVAKYLLTELDEMIEPGRTTLDEAKSMLSTLADGLSQSLGGMVKETKKAEAVTHSRQRSGIEPPGGAPTAPDSKQYDPRYGLDDEAMERDIIAEMKAKLGIG